MYHLLDKVFHKAFQGGVKVFHIHVLEEVNLVNICSFMKVVFSCPALGWPGRHDFQILALVRLNKQRSLNLCFIMFIEKNHDPLSKCDIMNHDRTQNCE